MNSREIRPLPQRAIVAVGDSYRRVGGGRARNLSSPARGAAGPPVVNGGVGGFGTDQMALGLPARADPQPEPARRRRLDDDINRAGYKVLGGARKPWFSMSDGKLILHNNPVPPPTQAIDRSPLARTLLSCAMDGQQFRPGGSDPLPHVAKRAGRERAGGGKLRHARRAQGFCCKRNLPVLIVMIYGGLDRIATMDKGRVHVRPVGVIQCATATGLTCSTHGTRWWPPLCATWPLTGRCMSRTATSTAT